jgi:hypothetical protein
MDHREDAGQSREVAIPHWRCSVQRQHTVRSTRDTQHTRHASSKGFADMSEINPASTSIVDDVKNAIAEKAAVARAELWAKLGYPTAKTHMPEQEYLRDYRGRHYFMNKHVLEQAQYALRIVLCPKCIEEKDYGSITGTRFFITVEDDVMTVFKAMGHFICHYCGFEEYHPLKHDPRVQMAGEAMEARNHQLDALKYQQMAQLHQHGLINQAQLGNALGPMFGGVLNNAAKSPPPNPAKGIDPGMGPIWGMTESEKQALYRLYNESIKKQAPPPPIVGSRQEAEELLKLAPIERRQSIIQKLRDLGKI